MKTPIYRHLFAASFLLLAPAAFAQSVAGLWDATITYNDTEIPFRLELSGSGANIKGWFFNGDNREVSNSGKLENGNLVLNFDSYLAKLTGTIKDGVFDGEYGPMLRKMSHVHAVRAAAARSASKTAFKWTYHRRPMGSTISPVRKEKKPGGWSCDRTAATFRARFSGSMAIRGH